MYYATLVHELTYWTGHESRLDRALSSRFGNEAYAIEELVAELGAAFLCAGPLHYQHAAPGPRRLYRELLEFLKRDKSAIFTAARKARPGPPTLWRASSRRHRDDAAPGLLADQRGGELRADPKSLQPPVWGHGKQRATRCPFHKDRIVISATA
jgi:hypothetical protein